MSTYKSTTASVVDATDDPHLERVQVAQPKKNVLGEILRQKAVLKPLYNVDEDRMDVLLGPGSYQSLKEQAGDLTYIRDQSVVEDRVEGMRIRQLSHPTDLILVAIRP